MTLHVDAVTEARWWEHADFSDETHMLAAELVAFDVLDPVLRSRGQPQGAAQSLAHDERFRGDMARVFTEDATGRLRIPSLRDALERIDALEERVRALERALERALGDHTRS